MTFVGFCVLTRPAVGLFTVSSFPPTLTAGSAIAVVEATLVNTIEIKVEAFKALAAASTAMFHDCSTTVLAETSLFVGFARIPLMDAMNVRCKMSSYRI